MKKQTKNQPEVKVGYTNPKLLVKIQKMKDTGDKKIIKTLLLIFLIGEKYKHLRCFGKRPSYKIKKSK